MDGWNRSHESRSNSRLLPSVRHGAVRSLLQLLLPYLCRASPTAGHTYTPDGHTLDGRFLSHARTVSSFCNALLITPPYRSLCNASDRPSCSKVSALSQFLRRKAWPPLGLSTCTSLCQYVCQHARLALSLRPRLVRQQSRSARRAPAAARRLHGADGGDRSARRPVLPHLHRAGAAGRRRAAATPRGRQQLPGGDQRNHRAALPARARHPCQSSPARLTTRSASWTASPPAACASPPACCATARSTRRWRR